MNEKTSVNLNRVAAAFWTTSLLALLPAVAGLLWIQSSLILGACVLLGLSVTLLYRWDLAPTLPAAWTEITPVLAGLLTGILAAFLSSFWLGTIGFTLVLIGFLKTHRDRRVRDDARNDSLLHLAWFAVPLIGCPPVLMQFTETWLQGFQIRSASGILRSLQSPHLVVDDSIQVMTKTIAADMSAISFPGMAAFVLVAVAYSVWMGRNWAITLANVLSAVLWWVLASIGYLVFTALAENYGMHLSPRTIVVICIAGAAVLFLSAERGIRGLLAPVTDATGDARQANPLIAMWNRIGGEIPKSRTARHRSAPSRQQIAAVSIVAGLAFVCQIGNLVGWIGGGSPPGTTATQNAQTTASNSLASP